MKRLIVELESVANDTLTPSENYPMIATISVGATKTNNKNKNRLFLFLDLLDKHGDVYCSGVWNLENKEQESLQQELEALVIDFIKEVDPNKD